MRLMRIAFLLAGALAAAACSKDKVANPPAELVDFDPLMQVTRVWSVGTKGGEDVLRLGLRPAVAEGRAYVAGHGGDVRAIELGNGRELWRADTGLELSGGPGVGAGLVVVGSSGGRVVALDAATGAERWRTATGGEVLAAPEIAGNRVVVRTVDGRLHGLRASDGQSEWTYEQPVPRLSLRGTAPPVVAGDIVIAGLDNGRVVALALDDGELLWTTTVAPSRGRTEIERLVDIDSPVRVVGDDVFVVGYQGRIAMLARESGQIWWGRDLSSHRGLAIGDDALYVSTADSRVLALRRRDGTPLWEQEILLNRAVTAPALLGGAVVVADFEGYLHWFDADDGRLLARAKSGVGRVTNAPVAAGELLLLQGDGGEVQAWRAGPRGQG